MSTKQSTKASKAPKKSSKEKDPTKISDKEAGEALQSRRIAEGRVVATPPSASKASAVDIQGEKRRIAAESNQQVRLKEAFQSQQKAADDRRNQSKRTAEAQKKAGPATGRGGDLPVPVAAEPGNVFTVNNPTGEYLEYTFRGETIILQPGSNEFGDDYLPGVKGEDIAAQAAGFFGFSHNVKAEAKKTKQATKVGDEISLPDVTAGAVAYPGSLYDEIKGVSNPSADERAQPFRFPANTEHDPQGVKTRATKEALIEKHEESDSKDGKRRGVPSARGIKAGRR